MQGEGQDWPNEESAFDQTTCAPPGNRP